MQFKRGGWQYSEADGVVTMPGNARQAFPAKRGAAGRTGGKGGLRRGRRTETIIQYVRGVQVVYCVFAFTQFSARFARDITQSRFIQRDATLQSSSGRVAVFNPGEAPRVFA